MKQKKKRVSQKIIAQGIEHREVDLKLIRQEGEGKVHIGGKLKGRGLCAVVMDTPETLEPLNVKVHDICLDCLVKHMGRKGP